jgi:hypothetical protein
VNVTECDNCRKIGASPPPAGWVIIAVEPPADGDDGGLAGLISGRGAVLAGTFCGWPCAAEWSAVKALIPESEET